MEEKITKLQEEDKIRCTQYLLEMIEKYGAEIKEEMLSKSLDSQE